MEQFSPSSSKIFSAAAFANLYSSVAVKTARSLAATVLLALFLILGSSGAIRPLYFLFSITVVFSVFEIFYHAKILKERPVALKETGNLADSFSFETAQLLLKIPSVTLIGKTFRGLLASKAVQLVLNRADVTQTDLNKALAGPATASTPINFAEIATLAGNWAQKEGRNSIDTLDILLALVSKMPSLQKILFERELKEEDLLNIIFWVRSSLEKDQRPFWERSVEFLGQGLSSAWTGGWTLETERYTFDVTEQMQKKKIAAFLVGRNKEIEAVEEVLARSEKRNVILLGPPGIGKTTIVYGLAEKSIQGLLPPSLKYKRFLELDVTALTAGAAGGELESRIQNLLTEITHASNVVLFTPEIENLAGSSGTGVNVTGHFLTALSSGRLQVIATSTREAFRRYIETQKTFAAAFEVIELAEPSGLEATRILEEAAAQIEAKNRLMITYKAIGKVVELSERYLVDRVLPGKAIDLLDEAAAAASLKHKKLLEPGDIEELLSQKTKIPIKKATGSEAKKLLELEKILHQRIIGQEEAIVAISNALRRARTIQRETKRPIGTFLFLGPTGVGKTETAKALSSFYFGSEEAIVRLDLSEFQEASSLNRLIGAPPGTGEWEEGGEFTEKVRQSPYSLILLDELEKAHPKVQEVFLPIFDEGIAEDATGRKIVFTNTIIIATSNAGAEFIRESIQQGTALDPLKKALLEKLQREGIFKPEFLNRFDDIIVYKPLSPQEVVQVVSLLVKELEARLKKQDIALAIDSNVLAAIAAAGYDPTYGARPLRRYIADHLEEPIAEKILTGQIKRGSQIVVSVANNQLTITA